jgi:tetratricopeptide (TPR) repeat protein/tRNA A-37 threonylcarbamoyl transferase component Bud32
MASDAQGRAMTNTLCIDEGVILAFLAGTLSEIDRSQVEGHVAACPACAELMTWAAADQAHRSQAVGREGRPFVGQLHPGSRVERYQILGAIGRGGMGEVYAAYHPDLDRRIALKVVHQWGADSMERRARLLREARAIARLSHPNVVSVYDAGTVDDRVYIAMEFVDGETVDAWLRSQPRSWREVVDVFIAAARGLASAHAAGIVHRDFKPQNVMIGRDGTVRVMDFGLARLADEPLDRADAAAESDRARVPATVTKTGALVGTVAYMAPEQFRGEAIDARADQFSFCVALHEALFGSRPALAHMPVGDASKSAPSRTVPSWLRAVVSHGLAENRGQRFGAMDDLIRALAKGRARPRRRLVALSLSLAVMIVALGGWRVARGGHIECTIPNSRLDAIWSGRDDLRRQAVHRAFAASGRPTAETSWERVSKALDDYIRNWSTMYVETCEATHARGEQSSEVLDLRMACLNDNLDQVRALTHVLATADTATIGHAVSAASELTPVSRCADVSLLRSAVPLPHDQQTLETVRSLRSQLREAEALRDAANFSKARARAIDLLPQVEATGYKPLLAAALEIIGGATTMADDPVAAETILHRALCTAEAARDDAIAAKATVALIGVVGMQLNRRREAEIWLQLSESILDRLGPGYERLHAWALNNFGGTLQVAGDQEGALRFARKALALKEQVLENTHPDVAITLGNLANALEENGNAPEALEMAEQAINILTHSGDPESDVLSDVYVNRGQALVDLGRTLEAEASFSAALQRYRRAREPSDRGIAMALQGIGDARVVRGTPEAALPSLEEALRIRLAREPIRVLTGETQFSLARALWESGGDRRRALGLAASARTIFRSNAFARRERSADEWLSTHKVVR